MMEDLYDLIGGPSPIEAATEVLYDKVLQDDSLRHFFERVDVAHLRSRQSMFISMLRPGRVYTGKDIRDAHARSRDHGLKDVYFDPFLARFRAALEEVGVKPENAEIIMKRLESKRGTVLDTRDCLVDDISPLPSIQAQSPERTLQNRAVGAGAPACLLFATLG